MAIVDSAIPEPSADQVLIQVVVSGSNPKDWKMSFFRGGATTRANDIAGVVAKVGANVSEFRVGDRVAAFHEMMTPHGSYAEYAIAWAAHHLPHPAATSFEEAAALPLAAMTAAIGLYVDQGLRRRGRRRRRRRQPLPPSRWWCTARRGRWAPTPCSWRRKSGVHPIICVAGSSAPYVETLIDRSRGDTIVDYRAGNEAVVAGLKAALAGADVVHAFDAVSEHDSYRNLSEVLSPGAKLNTCCPSATASRCP